MCLLFLCYSWKLTVQKKTRTYLQYDVPSTSTKPSAGVAMTVHEQEAASSQEVTSQDVKDSNYLKPAFAKLKF